MKIWLVDKQRYFRVTYIEIRKILQSGLTQDQWTRINIQPYLFF